MSLTMTAVAILLLLALLLVATAFILGAWWLGRRLLVSSLVPQHRIDDEARALIDRYRGHALEVAEQAALDAWTHNDFAAQGRWERIERAVIRLQRAAPDRQPN